MTLRDFITALPKAEINLQLTGALRKQSLLLIANQNGIPAQLDDFDSWIDMLDQPDPTRLDEIARVLGSWIMYPEDLALVVYDIGVSLSKQNIRYAEVAVAPSDFVGSAKMNFDTFLDALNDGRDRAARAWNVDMSWILCIPRDNPRAGDDVARWATGSAGRRGKVVAMGLTGASDAQPIGQFRRAFATARKKELVTVAFADERSGTSELQEIMDELQPNRLVNAWRLTEDEALLAKVADRDVTLVNSIARALRSSGNGSESENAISLQPLWDRHAKLALSCDYPSLYPSSLVDEYLLAQAACDIPSSDLTQLARRSIELSFQDRERKEAMLRDFDAKANSNQARFLKRS